MNPAYSVIFFSTASGAGYGLLVLVVIAATLGIASPQAAFGAVSLGLALSLITAGLLASTLHLGHPERAWRAVSQWRSSWLSREGVAAIVTYLPALGYAFGWVVLGETGGGWAVAGVASAVLAAVTVGCTAMIYASLEPVPAWRSPWVLSVYLMLALASGMLLLNLLLVAFGLAPPWFGWASAGVVLAGWGVKLGYWRSVSRAPVRATSGSATGLDGGQAVRLFQAPHSEANFVMREMGFEVARRHALRLRRIALVAGAPGAAGFAALSAWPDGTAAIVPAVLAVASGAVGILVERWLFFAEARHVVALYYGARSA